MPGTLLKALVDFKSLNLHNNCVKHYDNCYFIDEETQVLHH